MSRFAVVVSVGMALLASCSVTDRDQPQTQATLVSVLQTDLAPPSVEIIDDTHVRIVYLVGSCGTEKDALELPQAIEIQHAADEILLAVDGEPECSGVYEPVGYVRAAIVELDEVVAGRSVRIEQMSGTAD